MLLLLLLLVILLVSVNSLKLPNLSNKFNTKTEVEVIPPDYKVPIGALGLSVISTFAGNPFVGVPLGAIGALLTVQAGRVRFQFDNEALEIKVGNDLADSRENFVVGGKNRWKYSTFTEWYFIPNKEFPILMYFKENQTKKEGQPHLFPVIMNGKQLYDVMMKRVGPK